MQKFSSGIQGLDRLLDTLYVGDNVVWEVEAGTLYPLFIQNFIIRSFQDSQNVIYVSFNRSPQSVLNKIQDILISEHFILVDCFTSGKGKNDSTFSKFYDNGASRFNIVRIDNPKDIDTFTHRLNSIEEGLHEGVRYVFDSLTGMQDLWGNEDDTYRFFTYMCPRLYDLGTVAYWILEKDAHSQKFKANLRHITQVVLDLYKRRDKLYLKALKLDGRQDREAFKPHLFEINDREITISLPRRETPIDIGSKLKEIRTRLGMSQKELADKIDVTASFISQVENSQISPSLNSFLQICQALGVQPGEFIDQKVTAAIPWLVKREKIRNAPQVITGNIRKYTLISNDRYSAFLITIPPGIQLSHHLFDKQTKEFIYVVKGDVSVVIDAKTEMLRAGDALSLRESFPSQWNNKGGDEAEVIVIS